MAAGDHSSSSSEDSDTDAGSSGATDSGSDSSCSRASEIDAAGTSRLRLFVDGNYVYSVTIGFDGTVAKHVRARRLDRVDLTPLVDHVREQVAGGRQDISNVQLADARAFMRGSQAAMMRMLVENSKRRSPGRRAMRALGAAFERADFSVREFPLLSPTMLAAPAVALSADAMHAIAAAAAVGEQDVPSRDAVVLAVGHSSYVPTLARAAALTATRGPVTFPVRLFVACLDSDWEHMSALLPPSVRALVGHVSLDPVRASFASLWAAERSRTVDGGAAEELARALWRELSMRQRVLGASELNGAAVGTVLKGMGWSDRLRAAGFRSAMALVRASPAYFAARTRQGDQDPIVTLLPGPGADSDAARREGAHVATGDAASARPGTLRPAAAAADTAEAETATGEAPDVADLVRDAARRGVVGDARVKKANLLALLQLLADGSPSASTAASSRDTLPRLKELVSEQAPAVAAALAALPDPAQPSA